MRKSNCLIILLSLCLTIFSYKYCLSTSVILAESNESRTGGNCPEYGCNMCENIRTIYTYLTISPDQFPFKIESIKVTNASQNGMDIYTDLYPNFAISFYYLNPNITCDDKNIVQNQKINNSDSPYINNNGNIVIRVKIDARFCIQPGSYFPTSNFKFNFLIKTNYFDNFNGNVIRSTYSNIVHDTGLLYNECDGSIPFHPDNNTPGQGPIMNPRGPLLKKPESLPKELELSAYPNPFSEKIVLRMNSQQSSQFTVSIFDSKGCLLATPKDQVYLPKGEHNFKLDLSDLSPGLYLLKLTGINENQTIRIIKGL